jgi:riboflavin kinase/FMN adenylyltransferase
LVWVTSALDAVLSPTTVALGNFDGVHRGHQRVIAPILHEPGAELRSTVVSFWPHPKAFFTGRSHPLLTPIEEKAQVLGRLGVEQFVVLPFDQALADLTPEAFTEQILMQRLQARMIAVGADFHFGKGRSGSAERLRDVAAAFGVPVTIVPLVLDGEGRISSSRIRSALTAGDLVTANELLGRPYAIVGRVESGQQLARKLGFPTANLAVASEKLLPRWGVYAVRSQLEDGTIAAGIANIGQRPTVDGSGRIAVEVHLLDWAGDLYGQALTIELLHFLRAEQRFGSLADLQAQITRDCAIARDWLLAAARTTA